MKTEKMINDLIEENFNQSKRISELYTGMMDLHDEIMKLRIENARLAFREKQLLTQV
jgi:hypothetical protein